MEDDKLKDLFAGFKPELPPERDFMARLERQLDAIEAVRLQMERDKADNRRALYISSVTAFVAGFLFSLALPAIGRLLLIFVHALPSSDACAFLTENITAAAWILVALATIFIAINTYDIALSLIKSDKR